MLKFKIIIILFCCITIFFLDSIIHPTYNQRIKSDVIVVLAGDKGRLEKAVELYKQGYAKNIILTPVSFENNGLNAGNAMKLEVDSNDIISEYKSTSTFNTIQNINKIMDENKFTSAIIVTSDYHMKRTIMTFNKYKYKNYSLHYVSSHDLQGRKWYERSDRFKVWFSELKKLTGYRLHLYKFIDE
ncbi:YdcF family protein [Macrococcus animalis]|uniref:YdcF family protein n=1 Tax=Macrococcus animalis TaxID=3395467 RepID=UPI0039BE2CAB